MTPEEYHVELLRRAGVLARLWSRALQRLAAAEGKSESEVIAELARDADERMLAEQFSVTGHELPWEPAQSVSGQDVSRETPAPQPREPIDPAVCTHPAARQWWWHAYDGTLCGACCDCGTVLRGGVTLEEDPAAE